ncbi:MAG: HAD-IA family hydrolase [Planctomycetes bacterium]|nr:HAD-IA family hydrolase [Planctomycetota bacterium]
MALRALFLDVGNTLLTERPSRFELYAAAARGHGLAVTEAEMNAMMRRAHHELPREIGGAWRYTDRWFEAYIERIFHGYLGVPRGELAPLANELFAHFSRAETFALFPGALELVERARALGLRVGIVSNWSTRLPLLLDRLDLSRRFDFVVCSAVERMEKPDRAIFEHALALARVAPEEALHAGDDLERDVLGAQRAGLRSVLVDHARAHADWNASFAPRVTSLAELAELVELLAG